MTTRPTALHLLDLPVEILSQILRPLLTVSDGIEAVTLCPCRHLLVSRRPTSEVAQPAPSSCFPHPILPILLIHPRLHAVACPLLYASNTFVLDLTGEHHAHVRRWMRAQREAEMSAVERRQEGTFLQQADEAGGEESTSSLLLSRLASLRRIVRLEIRVDRLRSWIQDDVVPLVTEMTIRGRLVRLDMTVRVALTRRDVFLRPPLCGLVALLADPDLGLARMWVARERWGPGQGWEAFQVGGREDTSLEREEEGEEEDLVEVDWRGILREVDPKGEMFPMVVGVLRGEFL